MIDSRRVHKQISDLIIDFFGPMFSQGEPTPEVTLKQTLTEVIHPNQVRHLTSMRKGVAMFLEYLNIRGRANFQLEIRANATQKDGLYSWIPSAICLSSCSMWTSLVLPPHGGQLRHFVPTA